MRVRWAVADDERIARQKLRDLLAEVDWLECVGEAADGNDAVSLLTTLRPDLVFLDIRMPGRTGLDVLRALPYSPLVVFTTAFDEHAVTAFELRALDYLVKPFSRRRLFAAIERVRDAVRPAPADLAERADAALSKAVPDRVYLREGTGLVSVPVAEIRRIEARDDYSAIFAGSRRVLILRRLGDLTRYLEPAGFARVHRSHLVNRRFIAALRQVAPGRTEVVLSTGESLPVSRTSAAALAASLPGL